MSHRRWRGDLNSYEFSKYFHESDDLRPEYNDPAFKQSWLKRIRNEVENLYKFNEAKRLSLRFGEQCLLDRNKSDQTNSSFASDAVIRRKTRMCITILLFV
jgi:hypothetical protein